MSVNEWNFWSSIHKWTMIAHNAQTPLECSTESGKEENDMGPTSPVHGSFLQEIGLPVRTCADQHKGKLEAGS